MQTTPPTPAAPLDQPSDLPPVRLPDAGPTCLCGARVTGRRTQCRKCRARERWHRRYQLHEDNRRRTDAHQTAALLIGGAR